MYWMRDSIKGDATRITITSPCVYIPQTLSVPDRKPGSYDALFRSNNFNLFHPKNFTRIVKGLQTRPQQKELIKRAGYYLFRGRRPLK